MNNKKVKTDFIIVRVDPEFKARIVAAAEEIGEDVSKYVRSLLEERM